MRQSIFFIVFTLIGITFCQGAVIRVPEDQPTIQAGIDVAVAGDTVLVADGTYTGAGNDTIDFTGKAITVTSRNGPEFTLLPDAVVSLESEETSASILSGFRLRVIAYGNACQAIIADCIVHGGGIVGQGFSSPTISDCVITGGPNQYQAAIDLCCHAGATISNCLIVDNAGSGLSIDEYNEPMIVRNCTISANGGNGIICESDAGPLILNSIIKGNAGMEIDIDYANGAHPQVDYSDIDGFSGGTGNINADPLFVSGPLGGFYLSELESGQEQTSPCVDAGSGSSSGTCFQVSSGLVCMDARTTRTDRLVDAGTVDMGFHYKLDLPEPTPTPSPTPEACSNPGVTLWMPSHYYHPGDPFACTVLVCNGELPPLENYRLFVVLMIYGEVFFWPSFTPSVDSWSNTYQPGVTEISILPEFTMPDGIGSVKDALFISAVLDPDNYDIYGGIDIWNFGWGP